MNIPKALDLPDNSRLLMVHADDAGLSCSENCATIGTLEYGLVTSYSMMVPCPWFYQMAEFAKSNPKYDYGIHLTLTCEWEQYRFGPVLRSGQSSLVDEYGHFYKTRSELASKALLEDVIVELRAQIHLAYRLGLNPSHLDSHMYSVGCRPDIFQAYLGLGEEFKLPVFVNRQIMKQVGISPDILKGTNQFEVDHLHLGTLDDFEKGNLALYYESVLNNLPEGLNVLIVHPAFDDWEMKGITKNHPNFGSGWRQVDFDFFTSQESLDYIEQQSIYLISWKDIKQALRKS